jgi:hypothetical protein
MSRYEWKRENLKFAIGYDKPMRTFFAQVHDESLPEKEDNCIVWLGGNFDEYPALAPMLEKLSENVPHELQLQLEADQRGSIVEMSDIQLPPEIKKIC